MPATTEIAEVEARATFPTEGINDTAATWHAEYTYANGVRLIFTSDDENPHGVRFEGTEGWIAVAMTFMGVSGLYLWWPRKGHWKQAFLVKRGARGVAASLTRRPTTRC